MTDAKQTPLTDSLRRVPRAMSSLHESPDQQGTMNAVVDMLMHEAVDEIDRLTVELAKVREDAARYRWIVDHCRSTSEHWGGRWSIIVDGPRPERHDDGDAFDAAIDAAMNKEQK